MAGYKQTYLEALSDIESENYSKAEKTLESIKKHYCLAYFTIATLYANGTIAPPAATSPIKAAVDELLKGINAKSVTKEFYDKVIPFLEKYSQAQLVLDVRKDIWYLLGRCHSGCKKNNLHESFKYFFQGFEENHKECIQALSDLLDSPLIKKRPAFIEIFKINYDYVQSKNIEKLETTKIVVFIKILFWLSRNLADFQSYRRSVGGFRTELNKYATLDEVQVAQLLNLTFQKTLEVHIERCETTVIHEIYLQMISVMSSMRLEQEAQFASYIGDYFPEESDIDSTCMRLFCTLAGYYIKAKNFVAAEQQFAKLYDCSTFWDNFYKEYETNITLCLTNIPSSEVRSTFERKKDKHLASKEAVAQVKEATARLNANNTVTDEELIAHISTLKLAIRQHDESALQELDNLIKKTAALQKIRVLIIKYKTLRKYGQLLEGNPKKKSSFSYTKNDLRKIVKEVRKEYELLLKNRNALAYFRVATASYYGDDFFEKNLTRARSYFKTAFDYGYQQACYEYIHMCFYALGGNYDFETIQALLTSFVNIASTADHYYLLGEIYYFYYLDAKQDDAQERVELNKKEAIRYCTLAVSENHAKAKLLWQILGTTDDEGLEQESPPQDDEQTEIYEEYRSRDKEGVLNLISTICYESMRHSWDSEIIKRMVATLCQLDNYYQGKSLVELKVALKKAEEKEKTFFDENISDDSDAENEGNYQRTSKEQTGDLANVEKLEKRLKVDNYIALLKKLKKAKIETEDDYKKKLKEFSKSDLKPALMVRKSLPNVVHEDLQTVNHYASQGKLEEALKLVTTNFLVAQSRGVEFRTRIWNQPQRRFFKKQVHDKQHPLNGKPIYSFAVYDHAGIKDFTDQSDITCLKLEQSARLVYFRLKELYNEEAQSKEDLAFLDLNAEKSELLQRSFKSRMDQVQQLYTCDKDKFELYLSHQVDKGDPCFVSRRNPFVSTGDPQAPHAAKYAYGNKPYTGHKDERLRPCYGIEGRAHRPYVGSVYLTLHPLIDYTPNIGNYVPQLNSHGYIVVPNVYLSEREMTFLGLIHRDRVHYIHVAKFPSFHNEWSTIHKLKFCLDKPLFDLFKVLITENPPHSYKRRLTTYLLGEYISNFISLYLTKIAIEKAAKKRCVLVFRDRYGGFSLQPLTEIDANPNGDKLRHFLRRMYTHQQRHSESPINSDSSDYSESEDLNYSSEDIVSPPPSKRLKLNQSYSEEDSQPSSQKFSQQSLSQSSLIAKFDGGVVYQNVGATSSSAEKMSEDESDEMDVDDTYRIAVICQKV